MARPKSLLISSMCRACRNTYTAPPRRGFATTSATLDSSDRFQSNLAQRVGLKYNDGKTQAPVDPMDAISKALEERPPPPSRSSPFNDLRAFESDHPYTTPASYLQTFDEEPYHLNVYAHRHNTHITFTTPARDPILSYSCGNLGLRNAQKSTYDASFQLAAYTFRKIAEKQWKLGGKESKGEWLTLGSIKRPQYSGTGSGGIEVILRGFGVGREAFSKALLGTEGKMLKHLICKVTDGTRLKFGGTRSPQVRRLG